MAGFKRRSRLFIIRNLQARYIGLILGVMFAAVMLTGYIVYVTTWIMFGEKLAAVYPQGLLMDIVKRVNFMLFTRMLILTPIVVIIGLVASNRIAGPIYHMRRYLDGVIKGDLEKDIRLRKNDELQDLASTINVLVKKMRKDKVMRREAIARVAQTLEEMEKGDGANSSVEKIRVLAREVKELGTTELF